ncbi:class I SAM-dependent methyltransferase [Schaalia sp. 19OD2882]|uniref:class I SAM-dependent methyltransferase n=1 Tax=Schaalia sp. 19OD2882 TaxID=2794089 RepID=UPI001C1E93CE|nr:class I SAM-dependent methyltransferase [Schaalia sp. 19OD2882]QWW20394.1 class I SAM-dependent methyltransferase [Schaalia sp. 19OD2882]
MNSTSHDAYFADNAANWDERARLHEESGYGIAELLADPTAISPELAQDVDRLGDLSRLDVIHLQCHLGTDTIGFSRLGAARVVGVDLSGESLRRARSIAERAGVEVEYVESNVYDARAAVQGDFDLVYTSIGVLSWLPDIRRWAQVVASLMRPGARFFVRDDHPMFLAVGDDTSNGLVLTDPYFECEEPLTWESEESYVPRGEGVAPLASTRNHSWNHSLGEVVTSLIEAGLVIDSLEETRESAWARWPDLMERGEDCAFRLKDTPDVLPFAFIIRAHRPQTR